MTMTLDEKINSLTPANRRLANQLISVISMSQVNSTPNPTDVDAFLADTERLDRLYREAGEELERVKN